MERTAQEWNLRHVFNIPGHQAWFITIYLQIGFTRNGMMGRLPFWLSGQLQPVAVDYLLANPNMASPTFVMLWQGLKAYRSGLIGEARCKEVLERSPWILREWVPDLLAQAKSRLDLVESERDEGEEREPLILGQPELTWHEGEYSEPPTFRCEVLAGMTFDLDGGRYEIRCPGIEARRLLRQQDGSYVVTGGTHIDLPFGRSKAQCSLVELSDTAGETTVGTQSLTLWDANYPITLFRSDNGTRMPNPEEPVGLDRGCFAIFHRMFSIKPDPNRTEENDHWWLVSLPGCREEQLALAQEGERVWWPSSRETHSETVFPVGVVQAGQSELVWKDPAENPSVAFDVRIDRDANLEWIRIGHEHVEFEYKGPGHFVTHEVEIQPIQVIQPTYTTLSFSTGGRRRRAVKRLHLKAQACILDYNGKVSIFEEGRALDVRNARSFIFHILAPQANDDERRAVWLLEGSRLLKRVGKHGIQLSDLAGYGAPIEIYRGLYNSDEKLGTLVERVRDLGLVKKILFNENGFTLETISEMEFSAEHRLIAWTSDYRFVDLPIEHLEKQDEERHWFYQANRLFTGERGMPSILAIGIFYRGHRIGSWFALKHYFSLTKIKDEDDAYAAAEMLRWFKAPIIDNELRPAILFLMRSFMGPLMSVWLSEKSSPLLGLEALTPDDEWLHALSFLGRGASLREMQLVDASQIVEAFATEEEISRIQDLLPNALARLDGLNASLIAKIASLYIRELPDRREKMTMKSRLLSIFDVEAGEVEEFSRKIGIHHRFVIATINRMVDDPNPPSIQQHNQELLLRHRLVRRMLTHEYINKIHIS